MEMLHSWPNLKIFLIYPVKWVPLSLCISFFFFFLWLCISEGRGCFPGGSDGKESAHSAGDPGSIPGLGRSPGGGNGNPLHYSCLENPMDKGAWWAPWGHKESDMTEWLTHISERTPQKKVTLSKMSFPTDCAVGCLQKTASTQCEIYKS